LIDQFYSLSDIFHYDNTIVACLDFYRKSTG
jgi:hypothetical protein